MGVRRSRAKTTAMTWRFIGCNTSESDESLTLRGPGRGRDELTARTVIGWPESIAEQWHTGLPDRKLILAWSRVKISTLQKILFVRTPTKGYL